MIMKNKKQGMGIKYHARWKYLDNNFNHNLMFLYDSWKEIPTEEVVNLDGDYWPVSLIVDNIIEQLNNSLMENAYPIYPRNPFTREGLTPKSLGILKRKLVQIKKPIPICLKLLLTQSSYTLRKIYSDYNKEDGFSQRIIDLFSKTLRYRIDPKKNSQNLFTGYWVKKSQDCDAFEELYKLHNDMPYQIFYHGAPIDNPFKNRLMRILENKFTDIEKNLDYEVILD